MINRFKDFKNDSINEDFKTTILISMISLFTWYLTSKTNMSKEDINNIVNSVDVDANIFDIKNEIIDSLSQYDDLDEKFQKYLFKYIDESNILLVSNLSKIFSVDSTLLVIPKNKLDDIDSIVVDIIKQKSLIFFKDKLTNYTEKPKRKRKKEKKK
jgi:hypothetical protein